MPIRIRATPQAGFWRCGVFHPPQPVEHPDGHFSENHLARLEAEPRLVVERVAGKPGGGSGSGGGGEDDPQGEERTRRIAEAVQAVKAAGTELTGDGTPKVEAVSAQAGFKVSADERDAAMAELAKAPAS